jgi:hypothetical protein
MRCAIAIGLAASTLVYPWSNAKGADINGPVSGFVQDGRARGIRPLNGMPGSATQGSPLPLPFSVGLAAISARLDFALMTDAAGDGTPLLMTGLRSGAPQTAAIEGAIPADGIVLSDSGDTAALYSNALSRVQFLAGLPGQSRAGGAIDISTVAGGVVALALDPQGHTALLAGGIGDIYRVDAQGALTRIAQVPGAGALAFLANGSDAVAASRTTGDVLLLHDLAGSLTITTLTGARDGIQSAVAVRAINGSEVAVVDGTGRLAAVDVNSSAIQWIDLAGQADRLEPLSGGLLALNAAGTRALLVLDISQGRTPYFIPPAGDPDRQPSKPVSLQPVHGTGRHL